ncbi:hypothetical protein DRQ25_08935 [Candidatus Fermentibacteria bacterium]|nr:MAG: hypothetical protein DRQ25_08935 [Candidatus Fermentibacteria bacterium]
MNYSGTDTALQIGQETTWGTSVAGVTALEFTSENFKHVPSMIESGALVGAVTTHGITSGNIKTEGDFTIEVNPDNIGLLLGLTLGVEAAPAEVPTDTDVYDHAFTACSGSTALPFFTALVDRKADVFTYTSNKIDSMVLESTPDGYLMGTFTTKGQKEEIGDSLEVLTYSTKRPFVFKDLTIGYGAGATTPSYSTLSQATSFTFTYNNALEDDLFTADGTAYQQEIDRQKREMTADVEVLYDATTNTLREDYYKVGDPIALKAEFVSTDVIETGYYYTLTIEMVQAYVTVADPVIGGPDRLRQTITVKAIDNAVDEPITITLRDAQATAYLAS